MKIFFITVSILFFSFAAPACEICGCGVGNYYIGLLPQFSRSFIGVRYQFSSFRTSITGSPDEYSKDLFQTVEVWGGYNIGKRWQVLGIIPFNFIHQSSDDGVVNAKGIGDVAVIGNYKIVDHSSATRGKKLITQQLWLGGGLKFATGKFDIDPTEPDLVALANTQVGSGSTDFILNAVYNINIDRFGVNTSTRYKINMENDDRYFFGNRFSANSIAYYTLKKTKTIITPNLGLLYEHTEANKYAGDKIAATGGYLLSTAAGVEVNFNKITVGCNAQLPVSQNFANEQTNTKIRGMLHASFSL